MLVFVFHSDYLSMQTTPSWLRGFLQDGGTKSAGLDFV
jgi:hypothetical protein